MKRWRRAATTKYWTVKSAPPSDFFQQIKDRNIIYGMPPLNTEYVECSDAEYIDMLEGVCTAFGGNWQAMEIRNKVLQSRNQELLDENKRLNNELLAGDLI